MYGVLFCIGAGRDRASKSVNMTTEIQKLASDPNFVVQFAVGDPLADLTPQNRDEGISLHGVFFTETKRYILKKAHLSKDDNRIFDAQTGRLVYNSHHPGKNPYEMTDPFGLTNQVRYVSHHNLMHLWLV